MHWSILSSEELQLVAFNFAEESSVNASLIQISSFCPTLALFYFGSVNLRHTLTTTITDTVQSILYLLLLLVLLLRLFCVRLLSNRCIYIFYSCLSLAYFYLDRDILFFSFELLLLLFLLDFPFWVDALL